MKLAESLKVNLWGEGFSGSVGVPLAYRDNIATIRSLLELRVLKVLGGALGVSLNSGDLTASRKAVTAEPDSLTTVFSIPCDKHDP